MAIDWRPPGLVLCTTRFGFRVRYPKVCHQPPPARSRLIMNTVKTALAWTLLVSGAAACSDQAAEETVNQHVQPMFEGEEGTEERAAPALEQIGDKRPRACDEDEEEDKEASAPQRIKVEDLGDAKEEKHEAEPGVADAVEPGELSAHDEARAFLDWPIQPAVPEPNATWDALQTTIGKLKPDMDVALKLQRFQAGWVFEEDVCNAETLMAVAEMYRIGTPLTPQDLVKAHALYSRAAEKGHAPAMVALGDLYRVGSLQIYPSIRVALQHYSNAAALRNSNACVQLGYMTKTRHGLDDANPEVSRDWFERAAALNNLEALGYLGLAHHTGAEEGIAKDPVKAFDYLKRAATGTHPLSGNALFGLAEIYRDGTETVKADARKAIHFFCRAGKSDASLKRKVLFELGNLFYRKHPTTRADDRLAFELFRRAEQTGCREFSDCATQMALMYGRGVGVKQNIQRAARIMRENGSYVSDESGSDSGTDDD